MKGLGEGFDVRMQWQRVAMKISTILNFLAWSFFQQTRIFIQGFKLVSRNSSSLSGRGFENQESWCSMSPHREIELPSSSHVIARIHLNSSLIPSSEPIVWLNPSVTIVWFFECLQISNWCPAPCSWQPRFTRLLFDLAIFYWLPKTGWFEQSYSRLWRAVQ